MRAGTGRAASQVVELVDYATLDGRSYFIGKSPFVESPESFDGTDCTV